MKKDFLAYTALAALTLSPLAVLAGGGAPANAEGDSHFNTQTQIRVDVDKDTKQVVLTKDDTTPDILTKAYVLKHADPYEVRPYITNAAGATMIDGNPARVEAAKYEDGTGVLIVSAEDYRFEKQADGTLSLDELISKLDRPGFTSSSGQPKWVYYAKHRSVDDIKNVAEAMFLAMKNDKTELLAGKDNVAVDKEINAVIFNAIPSTMAKLKKLIEEYDAAFLNINATVKVYEVDVEADATVGHDFEAWKAAAGKDLFTAAKTTVAGDFAGPNTRVFSANLHYTTQYLDFLVSKGKAKVATTLNASLPDSLGSAGETDPSAYEGYFNLSNVVVPYISENEASNTVDGFTTSSRDWNDAFGDGDGEVDADELISTQVPTSETTTYSNNEVDGNGKALDRSVKADMSYGLKVGIGATAYGETLHFAWNITSTNLIGFTSTGMPRTSTSQSISDVFVASDVKEFVLGGVEKKELVRVNTGVPFLREIPVLGHIFSSEDEIEKTTKLVTVVSLALEDMNTTIPAAEKAQIDTVDTATANAGEKLEFGFDQYVLDK